MSYVRARAIAKMGRCENVTIDVLLRMLSLTILLSVFPIKKV